MPTYKLMYFNSRGVAESIRFMFALKGVDFEDIRYEKEEWPSVKENMPQGAMPVLKIDGTMYCQSGAITKYLAREFDLYGDSAIEKLKIDELTDTLTDMTKGAVAIFYEADQEKKQSAAKKLVEETFPKFVPFICKRLKESISGFVVGARISLADIMLYRMVEGLNDFLAGEILPDYDPFWGAEEIKAHYQKVEGVPEISEYIKTRAQNKM